MELATYWDSCKEVSHRLGSMQRKKPLTRSSPIGDWSKGSTIGSFFWDRNDSGKIPYTCNRLFLISGFLGVVPEMHPVEFFALLEVFRIPQQITVSIKFPHYLG